MSLSPNASVVRRTIDLNYANKQRSSSLKWLFVNGALLAVLAYDLWQWCSGCSSALAWVEALGACVLTANCIQHVCCLARSIPGPAQSLSPLQQKLLGLKDCDLDSSFVVTDGRARATPRHESSECSDPGSLSPGRSWRAADSPPASPSPSSPVRERAETDEFISDGRTLAAYIRQQEERNGGYASGSPSGSPSGSLGGSPAGRVLAAPIRAHQLAVLPERKEAGTEEEGATGGSAMGAALLWRRLRVDPQRLTEYNLNLRLWLHVTVVGRVARELTVAEAGGAALIAGGAGAGPALLPFLRPFADKQYVADRIKELSSGGCLSAYRWDSGGRGWTNTRPSDAELLLHLLATYLDMVVPGDAFSTQHISAASGGAFSTQHISAAPAPPPRAPSALAIHRTERTPPHYVLVRGDETIEVCTGRNNLLHTILVFLACAARRDPPALCRLHLGAAGLNMLWILGR